MDNWKAIPAHGDTPKYAYLTTPLQKCGNDDRDYRLIRLENGLQAVIVHDPLADKAAACLNVAVGSLDDPPDMPGMAHFCEHMVSKGSTPFPAENDFLSFITSNGGNRNACTKPAGTYYWFSISPNLLSSALPRLAAFFHSPLFSPSVTAREINAVDSENKKNLQNDGRRIGQLAKGLSVDGHPWTKFGTGNLNSLTETAKRLEKEGHLSPHDSEGRTEGDGGPVGRETRRRLVEWWKKEYCAGRMTLAVVGRESLDELADIIAKYFSPIVNLGIDPRPTITEPAWGPKEMGSIIFVKTVKDFRSLSLTFPLAYQQPHYRSKPARFIAHLLGHEGPGSIYAYLKKEGWIMDLSAGPQTWTRGIQNFHISVTLTITGLLHYPDILLAIYTYIKLMQSSPLPEFLQEERKKLSELKFRFRDKTDPQSYVVYLAEELAEPFPPELLLSASSLIQEWDENLVRETLAGFFPERGRVMVNAKEHANIPVDAKWETERWYGTQYRVERLGDEILKKVKQSNGNPGMFLPKPNEYIPERFGVLIPAKEISEPAKYPTCVRETSLSALWHKVDDQFGVPKAHVKLDIRSRLAYATPRHAVLTRILADLIEDALAVVTYSAQLAGLGYTVIAHNKGLLVSSGGFSDKLPTLTGEVVSMVKNLVIDQSRLAVITEQLKLEYENFFLESPYVISKYKAASMLTDVTWSPLEKLVELLLITAEDVKHHKEELLSRIYIESLVTGNLELQAAVDIIKMVEDLLDAKPLAPSERLSDRSLIIPNGSNFVKQETVADLKEKNSSLTYYCHFGDIADPQLRSILDLVVHMMREPCFSQLRTKEQLGYIVSSTQRYAPGSMGLYIIVQSLRDPVYIEGRVEAFLDAFRQKLESLSVEELQSHKEGLIVKKLERLKNLRQEASRFWDHINSGYYDFTRHETDATMIRELTLEEILDAYSTFILPNSSSRRKLSVHLRSQQLESSLPEESVTIIEDEAAFKAGLTLSPSPIPVERVSHPNLVDTMSKSRL